MTYVVGEIIQAADYTAFRGANPVDTAYPNDAAAQNKLAALLGVGYGTRGYGQTANQIPAVSAGVVITAAQWNSLRAAMSTINAHTGSNLTLQNTVSPGDTIEANNGTLGRPNISSLIASLDSNRLLFDLTQMTLSNVLSSTRTTSWSVSVVHEFTATFTSEDAARYFFNTGGSTYVSASRSGGTASSLNSSLSTLLSNMGTIKVNANNTTYTGSGGTVYPIGYYQLIPSYQTLFSIASGSGPYYYNISYTLRARVENVLGANGGNGSKIRFQAVFETGLPAYDQADGTLISSISQLLASGVLTVNPPTWATVTNL